MTDAPSRAVARYDGPRTTAELQQYAQMLAVNTTPDGRTWRNEALPATFRGNPASVAFAVEYAKALDVSPVTAIIGIHIVDGKPTASAGLISALVRRAGHKIRTWIEGSIADGTAKGITTIHREDDPEFEYRSEWDLPRAVRAELMKRTADGLYVAAKPRSAWSTYPENMLKSRSITECARDAAEDAILGVHYTPEELGVDVDESGGPVYTVTQVPEASPTAAATPPPEQPAGTDTTTTTAAPAAPAADDEPVDAEIVEETPTPAPDDLNAIVEDCRARILLATELIDLTAVWGNAPILNSSERASNMRTGHPITGEELSILDLFKLASAAIRAGAPLLTGEQLVELGLLSQGELDDEPVDADQGDANLVDLDRLLPRLREHYPQAADDVVQWAGRANVDLKTTSDTVAGEIIDAIADGSALGRSWVESLDCTPQELVTRLLTFEDPTTLPAAPQDAAEAREQLQEQHEDAEAAKPATRGSSRARGSSAAAEARRAAEAAANTNPTGHQGRR